MLDRVLMARLGMEENRHDDQPALFHYLVRAFARADRLAMASRASDSGGEALVTCFDEIKRLCVSYGGLLLTMPDMFPQPQRYDM